MKTVPSNLFFRGRKNCWRPKTKKRAPEKKSPKDFFGGPKNNSNRSLGSKGLVERSLGGKGLVEEHVCFTWTVQHNLFCHVLYFASYFRHAPKFSTPMRNRTSSLNLASTLRVGCWGGCFPLCAKPDFWIRPPSAFSLRKPNFSWGKIECLTTTCCFSRLLFTSIPSISCGVQRGRYEIHQRADKLFAHEAGHEAGGSDWSAT